MSTLSSIKIGDLIAVRDNASGALVGKGTLQQFKDGGAMWCDGGGIKIYRRDGRRYGGTIVIDRLAHTIEPFSEKLS